jgi:hypothetical protein
MRHPVVYWTTTVIVAVMLLMSLTYLMATDAVVSGFAKAGYPQHLRIVLGIAKPAAAVVLLLPGIPLLKEWAYTGAAITWLMASLSAYLSAEGNIFLMPLGLLALLVVSYLSRPASRRLIA